MVVPFVTLSILTTGGMSYLNQKKANDAIGVQTVSYLRERVISYATNIALTVEKNKPKDLSYKEYLFETEEGIKYVSSYMKQMPFWQDDDVFLLIEKDGKILSVNGELFTDKNLNFIDEVVKLDSTSFSKDDFIEVFEVLENGNFYNSFTVTLSKYFFFSKIPGTDVILVFSPSEIMVGALGDMFSTMFIGSVMSFCIVALYSLWKAKKIESPLVKIQELSGYLYKGDLTKSIKIKNKDEFGATANRLNKAIFSLRDTIVNLKCTEEKTREMIELTNNKVLSIDNKTKEVSLSTERINSQVEESTAELEEIKDRLFNVKLRGDNIQKVSLENVTLSENILDSATSIITHSETMRNETIAVYTDAKNQLEDTLEKLAALHKIKEIAKNIADISNTTKILSINASIEASRAGEEGKGFRVLAKEIGNLAQDSAQSSSDIQDLTIYIDNILKELVFSVQNILSIMHSNMEKNYTILNELSSEYSSTGVNINQLLKDFEKETTEIANSLNDIFVSVESLSEVMNTVSASSDSISSEVNSVSSDMNDILNASNVNRDNMETLKNLISKFKTS